MTMLTTIAHEHFPKFVVSPALFDYLDILKEWEDAKRLPHCTDGLLNVLGEELQQAFDTLTPDERQLCISVGQR